MCLICHMGKANNKNTGTIRSTKTLIEEARYYVGGFPRPYLSLTKLNDESLRDKLKELKKQYPQFGTIGDSKK